MVATSSRRDAFSLKTQNNAHLFDLFDGNIICGDDAAVKQGKPAPDIFLAAAQKIGHELIDPSTCLVFEDSPSGVQAALNAKMNVIWIPDVNLTLDPILIQQCTEVLKSMKAFQPEKYGLPPLRISQ